MRAVAEMKAIDILAPRGADVWPSNGRCETVHERRGSLTIYEFDPSDSSCITRT
jgi:hypothetical protein